jgi:hypothetical protein
MSGGVPSQASLGVSADTQAANASISVEAGAGKGDGGIGIVMSRIRATQSSATDREGSVGAGARRSARVNSGIGALAIGGSPWHPVQ